MTILFPTDFSEASANAFGMVAVLAEKTGLPVTLIHIENPPIISPAYDDAGMSMVTDTLLADMDTMVHNRIAAFRDELNTRFHLDQRNVGLQEEVRIGFHGEEIARAAEELDAAYIVTSVRDVPLVNRVLFGGTVNAILRHTNRPVITLPEHQPLHQFQRIGYATDFSLDDGALITRLLDFARLYDARVYCFHVHDSNLDVEYDILRELEEMYSTEITEGRITFYLQENLRILNGLEYFIQEHNLDMLAMMRQKHYWPEFLNGSHTRSMALHARIPMLIFHE